MPQIPNRTLKHNPFQYLHTQRRKHDWLPLTYPGVPKYLWEIPPKKLIGTYVPYKERQRMGFDDLLTKEDLQKRAVAWEKDKHNKYNVRWIDENGVDHVGPPQGPNAAALQVVGGPPRQPVPRPSTLNPPTLVPTDSGPVFPKDNQQKSLWSSLMGRFNPSVSDADIRVQNTRTVRNSRREGVADMVTNSDEQSANGLGVVNGTQLSDGSIGTAPHVPLGTFLSSGNSGARTAHDLTHMQVLHPQPAYFPAALETKPQQGDKAHFPFKFEQTILPPSSYGTGHCPAHYKTNDPMISDQSFSTTHLGVDAFGNPYPPGEQTQFSQNVVRKHVRATKHTPFQDAKQLTPYAQGTLNEQPLEPWMKMQLQRIARQYGEQGPVEYNDIEDSGHIPTEQFLQKLEKRGAYSTNEAQKRATYSGSTQPTAIPLEPIIEGQPVQAPQVFQKLRKKKYTRFELDKADVNYKQTIKQFFNAKPTPSMQHLDEEIKQLEGKVKKTPEPLMDEGVSYEEQKKKIEKRKNDAKTKQDTKKVHKLEQQELILEQERIDTMRLEELQKLRLAAESEWIQHLEEQQREAEEIALAATEYEYQNTPIGRGIKAKAGEQLNRGIYDEKAREEAQAEVEAAKRALGVLVTTEGPYLLTQVNETQDRMKYKRIKNTIRKRKRELQQQIRLGEERIREGEALVIHNQKKEQYYKSAKLAPGALPTRTFAQNLEHLDNYIQHMRDDINARHGVMVPFTTTDTMGSFQPGSNEQPVTQRHIRLRRRRELPEGGRSQEFHVGAAGYTNFDVARQMLKFEKKRLIRDDKKIKRLTRFLRKEVAYKPTQR